jgi:gas vesicle protein
MSDQEQKQIKQLLMLISDLRARDQEKYESHIKFMNEVVNYIKDISKNLNQTWSQIHEKLEDLNKTISANLETLLQGIKPEDIRETSKSLETIMSTMNRSIQSMNLENVMRELHVLTTANVNWQVAGVGSGPQGMSVGSGVKVSGSNMAARAKPKPAAAVPAEFKGYESPALQDSGQEIYGAVPGKYKKGKGTEQPAEESPEVAGNRDEMGRLKRKPRDLFGNPVG